MSVSVKELHLAKLQRARMLTCLWIKLDSLAEPLDTETGELVYPEYHYILACGAKDSGMDQVASYVQRLWPLAEVIVKQGFWSSFGVREHYLRADLAIQTLKEMRLGRYLYAAHIIKCGYQEISPMERFSMAYPHLAMSPLPAT